MKYDATILEMQPPAGQPYGFRPQRDRLQNGEAGARVLSEDC